MLCGSKREAHGYAVSVLGVLIAVMVFWTSAAWGQVVSVPPNRKLLNDESELIKEVALHDEKKGAIKMVERINHYDRLANKYGKNPGQAELMRVQLMLLAECQDAIGRMSSDESLEVFKKYMPKMGTWGAVVMLEGISVMPDRIDEDWVKTVEKMATKARDFRVTVACIDFLGRHEVVSSLPMMYELLHHKKTRMPVQIAVVRNVAEMGAISAIPEIIKLLEKEDMGRLKYEAIGGIRMITGKNFTNYDQIKNWWAENKDTFKGPDENAEPLDFNWEVSKGSEDADPSDLKYYNIPLVAKRLMFVIDKSGSMKEDATISSTSSVEDGDKLPANPSRLDVAKLTLANLIKKLPVKYGFNVLYYSNNVDRFERRQPLVLATPANKKKALKFVYAARAYHTTRTTLTVEAILMDIALREDVGTIFVLTDGLPEPMIGAPTKAATGNNPQGGQTNEEEWKEHAPEQARYITFVNQTMKIRINTIGIGGNMAEFLRLMAESNDGQYQQVD